MRLTEAQLRSIIKGVIQEAPAKKKSTKKPVKKTTARKPPAKIVATKKPTTKRVNWSDWLNAWDAEFSAVYDDDISNVPLADVVEDDMVTLAIEKLQSYAFDNKKSAKWAIKQLEDRDAFAVKFYDPYEDEFKLELGIDDVDDEEAEADMALERAKASLKKLKSKRVKITKKLIKDVVSSFIDDGYEQDLIVTCLALHYNVY